MPTRSKLADVNVLAVFLVEDHPGHPYIEPVVSEGLAGAYRLIVPDQLPLRVRWILTTRWGVPKAEADRVIEDFLQHRRVRYAGATRPTLLRAFELAKLLRHDVYDTFLLALAESHGASAIITTDEDFRDMCREVRIAYENPVPPEVLARFGASPRR